MKLHKIFLISSFLASTYFLHAQEIISTGGDFFINPIGSMSITIGEPVIESFSGTAKLITQGFQQSKLIISTIDEDFQSDLVIYAYPNPVTKFVKINVLNSYNKKLRYKLFNNDGKLLSYNKIEYDETNIPFNDLPPASYILKVYSGHKKVKVFKIIKQ